MSYEAILRTKHLFHALGVAFESRVKFVDSKGIFLSSPVACY